MQVELSPEAEALVKEVVAQSAGTLTVSDIVNQAILSHFLAEEESAARIASTVRRSEARLTMVALASSTTHSWRSCAQRAVRASSEDRQRRPLEWGRDYRRTAVADLLEAILFPAPHAAAAEAVSTRSKRPC